MSRACARETSLESLLRLRECERTGGGGVHERSRTRRTERFFDFPSASAEEEKSVLRNEQPLDKRDVHDATVDDADDILAAAGRHVQNAKYSRGGGVLVCEPAAM